MDAKTFKLYRGGGSDNISNFRCDGTNVYSDKIPHQVAAEYAGGYFTMGFPLSPGDMRWQRNAFRACDAVAAGDFLAMLRIPNRHRISGTFLEIQELDTRFANWEIALKGIIYKDGEVVKEIESADAISLSDAEGGPTFVFTEDFDQFLEPGQAMVLGLKVVSVGEDPVPLSEFEGRANLSVSVQRFSSAVNVL